MATSLFIATTIGLFMTTQTNGQWTVPGWINGGDMEVYR